MYAYSFLILSIVIIFFMYIYIYSTWGVKGLANMRAAFDMIGQAILVRGFGPLGLGLSCTMPIVDRV